MEVLALWTGVDQTLRAPGPFTVYVVKPRGLIYSACEPHFVTWNNLWISIEPFASQADVIDALESFVA